MLKGCMFRQLVKCSKRWTRANMEYDMVNTTEISAVLTISYMIISGINYIIYDYQWY